MRVSRICRRMFLALMKEVRSLMLYTTTKPSAQSTGSSSIHLASEPCQEEHVLLCWYHLVCPESACWLGCFSYGAGKKSWSLYPLHCVTFYGWYYNSIIYTIIISIDVFQCWKHLVFLSLFPCFEQNWVAFILFWQMHIGYCLPIDYTDLILLLFLLIKHLTVSFHNCNI